MKKTLVLLLGLMAIVAVASAVSAPAEPRNPLLRNFFNKWMTQHNKVYESIEEEEKRFGIFRANMEFIREHNKEGHSYRVGMNEFGDLTNEEFRARLNGYRRSENKVVDPARLFVEQPESSYPASLDWRNQGAVTGVKNQQQCGGCWSFSATGAIEGQWALAGNTLVGLSEQNLIDCSTSYGNQGCEGGQMDDAFQYVIANNGIDSEASYPYTATGPNTCEYSAANKAASINSYKDVTSGSESALLAATATVGPISVAIDASQNSFQFYQSGVYYAPGCSSTNLDHGVLVVGYGASNGQDYWIVKNSWGTTWGIQGYIWMSRNRNNNCGIATDASYPLISGTTSRTGSSSGNSGSSTSGATTGGNTSGGSTGGYTSGGF